MDVLNKGKVEYGVASILLLFTKVYDAHTYSYLIFLGFRSTKGKKGKPL